eukprot:CAMPEP_0179417538 /NCGR_PEP_ID=MMETSP0799-20121207/7422_1 /TAXON_ID=46947 /ORGANISM="Geminigera cryophila, Strain CCMP2564" /LENGTH=189 /DNA_ID=CAMNT_0021190557 /DNA_START=106 /DNA_END=672 /DNA_ORIENTATION=+
MEGNVENIEPFLLVDWGGGAFNVAVYDVQLRQLRCLSALTDMSLGGQDIEYSFLLWLQGKTGLEITESRIAKFKVRKSISAAIRDLTVADLAEVEADNLLDGEGISCSVRQSEFNQMLQPLIAKAISHIHRTLAQASLDTRTVRQVVLLGGASRVPKFEAELEALFCEPLDVTDTPTVGARARGRVERT